MLDYLGRSLVAVAFTAAVSTLSAGMAAAQQSGCGDLQGMLLKRKQISDSLSGGAKRQLDPKVACGGFNQLVQNGTTIMKWAEANKDWCQVPDSFLEGVKADHSKAQEIRTKACGIAAKQDEMEKQAKNGGGGLLGGSGLSGSRALPSGAL